MNSHLIPAHLKRVRAERAAKCTPADGPPPSSPNSSSNETGISSAAVDSIAGHLFALTLTDNGPDAERTPSKLWSSCADFQDASLSNGVITNPPSGVSATSPFNELPPASIPLNTSTSLSSPLAATPALVVGGHRLSKKDHHRGTVKALQLLNNIELRIHHCSRLLLEPSDVDYRYLQHEVTALCQAVDNVIRNADSVKSKKRTLSALLQELEAQVQLHVSVSQGLVDISTGMRLHYMMSWEY
ncbi:hypothetical protein BDN67DRAFT_1017483 [Paxillus ammoniavirescens]|nr:hypothetical protein BDN67DRAFT_1017483 [Paxillus ammoniavirescens]